MRYLVKVLDLLTGLCVVLLFSKYFVVFANTVLDLNLRWYFLEDIKYLPVILFAMIFVFAIPSEMIKDKQKISNKG